MRRVLFLIVIFLQKWALDAQETCPSSGVICVTETQYQFCTVINGQVVITSGVSTCPTGQVCSSTSSFTCQASGSSSSTTSSTSSTTSSTSSTTSSTSTTTTTTTTAAPTTSASTVAPPVCNSTATYPGPACNQYYSCVYVMWWWESTIVTCPDGQAFNETSSQCEDSTTCVAS